MRLDCWQEQGLEGMQPSVDKIPSAVFFPIASEWGRVIEKEENLKVVGKESVI